jgi:thiamine-phosphate pyrophosphorylase
LILDYSKPLLYLITDRHLLPQKKNKSPFDTLIELIAEALAAGVDLVQIRERDLTTRELYWLTKSIADIAQLYRASVLVNERSDVAAACGVGVHLTTRSMGAEVIRKTFGEALLIGVSTHSLAEARAAESGGANFIVFGPVYETASKKVYGEPVGVEALREVTDILKIPVFALGGIRLDNYRESLIAGAAGLAAISLFSEADDLVALVKQIKSQE